MQAFPKPLNAEEEAAYLSRLAQGDREARNRLIEHNMRLVAYVAKKYVTPQRELEELISIGTIGLIKGVDSFREDKGIRLTTYVARCIDNELLMMVSSEKKRVRDVYLYDHIGSDKEGHEITLIDVLEAEQEELIQDLIREQQLARLQPLIQTVLTPRQREVICMRYGLGYRPMTQREVAARFGISRSYVSRIEKKSLEKLHKALEDDDQ